MATENFVYLTVAEDVKFHVLYMRKFSEIRFGFFVRKLIESAITLPQHASVYKNAVLIRQSATLLFGLIKNHPWEGGNKRTATFLTNLFLKRNGYKIAAETRQLIELCLKVESDAWKVDEIEIWLRERVTTLKDE